jgi:hypothetical protein
MINAKLYFQRLFLLGFCLIGMQFVYAHHSFPAQFDINKPETVTGVVTKLEWRNPHVYFYMDVYDAQGKVQEWSFELSNVSAMRGRGWSKDTLQAGDMLEVGGSRARDDSPLLNATAVKRSDSGEELL